LPNTNHNSRYAVLVEQIRQSKVTEIDPEVLTGMSATEKSSAIRIACQYRGLKVRTHAVTVTEIKSIQVTNCDFQEGEGI
jgi:hypothetical protein